MSVLSRKWIGRRGVAWMAALAVVAAPLMSAWAQDAKPAPAQPPANGAAPRITAKQAVEQAGKADVDRIAALTKGDYTALDSMLDDGLIYTHSSGKTDTKATLMDALKSGATKYVSLELVEPKYRAFGNTVVATGIAKVVVQSSGTENKFTARFTEVWTRRQGVWKLVAWQTTKIPDA